MARMIDRGQTLLVGAIALAVLFVSLALVLNTAIYGSTIASQGSEDVTGGQTVAMQSAVERDVASLIERAVERHPNSNSDQETYVENAVDQLEDRYFEYYAENDRLVNVSLNTSVAHGFETGDHVRQSGSDFSNDAGDANYDIVMDDRVRDFRIEVTSPPPSGTPFRMIFDGGSTERRVEIVESGGDTDVVLLDSSGTELARCTGTTVDVTGATVDDEHCNALDFFERLDGDYDLEFENAGGIQGTMEFTARNGHGDVSGMASDRVYSAGVDVSERSTRVDYDNTIRVAPGEPR